jgi:hypothetical protein
MLHGLRARFIQLWQQVEVEVVDRGRQVGVGKIRLQEAQAVSEFCERQHITRLALFGP